MSNSFYRAFEDRHRGSRAMIKSRLAAYLPFLAPLAAGHTPRALDLGCGRGEWLELLGESGFAASGVDLDEGMLAACRELGLNVATMDAVASLRAQPDASLSLVSAFHLVEHIPFEAVQELITQALRVLEPGGLLILETPNPENLVVATSGFYLDPSHLRPIPPQLLEFVVEFSGFARNRVVRLQEPPQLHGAAHLELMNVLNGASPDYSVVAQKAADLTVRASFDAAFAASYGLDLATLAQRYQAQHDAQRSETQASLVQLGERIAAAELNAGGLFQRTLETLGEAQAATRLVQAELQSTRQRERALEAGAHAQALHDAEARAREAEYLAAENAALAERNAQEARAMLDEQARQSEVMASHFAREAEQEIVEVRREAEQRIAEARRQAEQQFAELKRYADNTEQARAAAEAHAQHVQWQLNEMTARLMASEQQVRDLLGSSSWRMTRPARLAMRLLRRPLGQADVERMVAARGKAQARSLLMPFVRTLAQRPAARAFALRALTHFPALEKRLRSLAMRSVEAAAAPPAPLPPPVWAETPVQPGQPPVTAMPGMSRSAQNILTQLQRRLPSDDHTKT